MKNAYEVRGDVTAIIINSKKFGRQEALISTRKLDRVKEYPNSWVVVYEKTTDSLYARSCMPKVDGKRKSILLHRWITNAPVGTEVDHINHNTLDNTDSNLRVVTKFENQQNRKNAQRNSRSGVRGVTWKPKLNKWQVSLGINNKSKYIGVYSTIEEAEQAAIEARMHHMPYSPEALL